MSKCLQTPRPNSPSAVFRKEYDARSNTSMLGEPIGKECIKKGKCWDVNRGFLQCTGTECVMKSVWMWMG